MSPPQFAARMALIDRLGYRVIGLDEGVQRHRQGRSSARDLVITIDDAWLGTYQHMLPELERRGFRATLYVTTYYVEAQRPVLNVLLGYLYSRPGAPQVVARLVPPDLPTEQRLPHLVATLEALPTLDERWREVRRIAGLLSIDGDAFDGLARAFRLMNPDQVRDAADRGIDIQLHTHTHRMHGHVPELVAAEIELNRQRLATMLDRSPDSFRHFCYPSGEHDPVVFDAVNRSGVLSATTTEFGLNPASAHPLALRRILDGESLSDLEFEAMLSGFWGVVASLRRALSSWGPRQRVGVTPA
jgi:peptidoglycan/xylan/chitin deacetylase (PgdA/CDA1 family)